MVGLGARRRNITTYLHGTQALLMFMGVVVRDDRGFRGRSRSVGVDL